MKITNEFLKSHNACAPALERFDELFPNGINTATMTLDDVTRMFTGNSDWMWWFVYECFNEQQQELYEAQHKPLLDAYEAQHQPLWDAYVAQHKPLWDAYEARHKPLRDAYEAQCRKIFYDVLTSDEVSTNG